MEFFMGLLILVGTWLGYRMGRQEEIKVAIPETMKRIIRTEEEEADVIEKLQRIGKVQ